jgi:hypothetical protein
LFHVGVRLLDETQERSCFSKGEFQLMRADCKPMFS